LSVVGLLVVPPVVPPAVKVVDGEKVLGIVTTTDILRWEYRQG
jgi:CBS domain-containing protein